MNTKKLRVGFVGTGRISTLHQLFYQNNPEAELVAICDKNKKVAKEKADEWGIPKENIFTELDEFLKYDLDAVEVLTPHSLHKEHVVTVCEAGKHVSVQKVPCMSLSEYDAMQAAARKAGVKLKVYENFQFHPPYRKALSLIQSGELGKAVAVNVRMWNSVSALSAWDVPLKAWKWRISEKDNFKLPTLFDDGYHKHNIVHQFLGKDIDSVQAWKKGFRIYKVIKLDVPAVVSYKTRDAAYGTWNVSMTQSAPIRSDYYGCEEAVEIHCEQGIIWVNGCTGNMFVGCECGGPGAPGVYWIDRKGTWQSDCSMDSNWKYSFLACSRDFFEAIKEDRAPYRSGAEARHVLQVDLAMVASLRTGFSDFKVSAITDGLPKNLVEEEAENRGEGPEAEDGEAEEDS
ncbi:MAG TPA: Gfo/Idh/MocA family oxidoreductase [Candidatus Lokiarchaeia archaeon]|nr:Gfo/Idh/MocA family oxidoreductase [Candidatus Lokiarchaeia archaeon]